MCYIRKELVKLQLQLIIFYLHNIFSRHPLWGLVYVLTMQLIQLNPIKSIQSGIITGYWNQLVCISSLYDERLLIVFQLKQPYKLNSNLF